MKKFLTLLTCLLLVVGLLAGCSASTTDHYYGNGTAGDMEMSKDDAGVWEPAAGVTGTVLPDNQKLIRTVRMDAETEELEVLLKQVNARISEFGGYVEEQSIYNGSSKATYRNRYASLTIRIPAEKLDEFVGSMAQISNVTSKNETTENITLSYIATESRIKALETEQTRLLELLAMAESMEDLLQIEARLTDVRAELEQVTSQLRLYDNQVSYGTVHLNLNEVVDYTQVEEPEGFFERIGNGFVKSLKNLGNILKETVIFLIVSIPYLLIPAAVATAVILLSRRSRKKKNQKNDTP